MVTQPETLTFGPQWIRKLSDFAPSSQRPSSIGAVDSLAKTISTLQSDAGDTSSETKITNGAQCQDSTEVHYHTCNRDPKPDGEETPDVPPDMSSAWNNLNTPPTMHQAWHGRSVTRPSRHMDLTPEAYSWDSPATHNSNSAISELRATDRGNTHSSSNHLDGSIHSSTRTAEFNLLDRVDIAARVASQSTHLSVLEDERDCCVSDCADQPDEHLWFYEDPQGRTQGSFTDSQMNDWLSAGIYFTSTLRIRRKCDGEFSTLADYTYLFGRIPFTKGPRVPPISGGITAAMLKGTSKDLVSVASIERCTSADQISVNGTHSASADTTVSTSDGHVSSLPSHVADCQSNFQASVACVLNSPNTRVSDSHLDSGRSLLPKTFSTGVCANSSLPVMQSRSQFPQVTSLSHSFGGLNICGQPNVDTNSRLLGCATQPAVSASTLMALASLISVNPALASLALSFSGQSQLSSNPDLRATAMSPGFLTALAQYLNVQPYGSGHIQVSPMQQLAETAQLAAQLAAMAGAYSPDQTPMQPAQALALAELVRSQASPWPLPARKDNIDDTSQCSAIENSDRLMEGGSSDVSNNRFIPGGSHSAGTHSLSSGGDTRSLPQSLWPSLHSINDNGPARSSPRRTDGFSLLPSHVNVSGEASTSHHLRDGASRSTQHTLPTHQMSKRHSQTVLTSVGTHSITDRINNQSRPTNDAPSLVSATADSPDWRWTCNDAVTGKSPEDDGLDIHTHTNASPQTTGATHWANKVKQSPSKLPTHVSPRTTANGVTTRRIARAQPTNNRVKSTGANTMHDNRNDTTRQTKSTPKATITSASTTPSPTKPTRSVPKASTPASTTVPVTPLACSSSSVPDPDRTAEVELRRLTEWCQVRLSAMPMREKVDIPTLVELLATLDAPYEVERMVQAFLNESTRTSLFVKDFLDQRRPFWQLHRERREKESAPNSVQQPDIAKDVVPRCSEKKRSSVGQGLECTTDNLAVTGCNGETGWTKVGTVQTTNAHDTQWHHIKPKGNHNRRGKKDKTS